MIIEGINKPMNRFCHFFSLKKITVLFILLISFHFSNPTLFVTASNLTLSQIYLDKWMPGGAFGFPRFVGTGNFTKINRDEIFLVSNIPSKLDVMTLLYFDGQELVYIDSGDRDCSTVYQYLIADFDGDGDDEFLFSDFVTDAKKRVGLIHYLYDYVDYCFYRNETLSYESSMLQLDKGTTMDVDNDQNDELVLSTWNQDNASELIRIYDYENNQFILMANNSHQSSTQDIFFRNIVHIGSGDFDGNGSEEIITISLWSLNSSPNQFYKSFAIYSYDAQQKNLTYEYHGIFPTLPGSNIVFEIGDIDLDHKDEIITYLDRTEEPLLSIYEISPVEIKIDYSIYRPQSDYFTTRWYRTDLLVEDLDQDYIPEILIAETKCSGSTYLGRYEIYKIQSNILESLSLQEISESPMNICTGDIDSFSDTEIINVFSSYDPENQIVEGGIEVWTTGLRKTNQFSLINNLQIFFLLVVAPIPLIDILYRIRKKLKTQKT